MEIDGSGFEVLPPEECLRLLASERTGRLATHAGALPMIVPVSYAIDGDDVVVSVDDCSRTFGGDGPEVVAFEVDRPFGAAGGGWSVHVVGLAVEILDAAGKRAAEALGLRGWGDARCRRFVRISTALVTGRRVCLARRAAA